MHRDFSTVCVMGLGYIGLPTAALIASRGLKVVGVDIDPDIVATVSDGHIHITEADLDGDRQSVPVRDVFRPGGCDVRVRHTALHALVFLHRALVH